MDDLLELEQLRALAPAPSVRPLSPERVAMRKEILMREVVQSLDSPPSRHRAAITSPRPQPARRHGRLLVILTAALVVLSATAVAWALLTSSARDTVSVQCEIQGSSAVIPSATGDPVADCSAQWQRDTGSPAPPLVAYDNGDGGVTVMPAGETPPSGFTLLPTGETQNVSMVEMQQWLDDYVTGLNSGCYDDATATRMTQQALTRFGIGGWTVQPPPSSDTGQCLGTGILDPTSKTVTLRALGGPVPPDSTVEKLAAKLRAIAQECAPLDTTATQVRSAANELGLSENAHQFELTQIRDNTATCTTISENVGGTIFLLLRGPSS
jgi:hypothetical protein